MAASPRRTTHVNCRPGKRIEARGLIELVISISLSVQIAL
jgi:hypothetical protein